MMSAAKRVLILDDEALIALDVEMTLADLGYEAATAMTVTEALQLLEARPVDLAIVDYHLKDGNADEVLKQLRSRKIPFVVCSGSVELQELQALLQGSAFLAKPFTTDRLVDAVTGLVQAVELQARTSVGG
jgi:two-component system, OmpR family, sensor histidine kinase TorS